MGHCISWFGCWFPSPWEHTISCPVCCCISFFFTHFIWHVHISIYEPFMDELYGSLCTLYFALCLFTLHVYYMTGDVLHDFSFLFFFFWHVFSCYCMFLPMFLFIFKMLYNPALYNITLTLHI